MKLSSGMLHFGAVTLALAASPLSAQEHDHAGHTAEKKIVIEKEVVQSDGQADPHAGHAAHMAEHASHMGDPGEAIIAYRDALVALDLDAAGAVFAEDALVFENGKDEGGWTNYAEKHLGPELGHFVSFSFPKYEIEVRHKGHFAFGVERYSYRIELHDGRVIERDGVATSVLEHSKDGWKIKSYHSSSRAPRK